MRDPVGEDLYEAPEIIDQPLSGAVCQNIPGLVVDFGIQGLNDAVKDCFQSLWLHTLARVVNRVVPPRRIIDIVKTLILVCEQVKFCLRHH